MMRPVPLLFDSQQGEFDQNHSVGEKRRLLVLVLLFFLFGGLGIRFALLSRRAHDARIRRNAPPIPSPFQPPPSPFPSLSSYADMVDLSSYSFLIRNTGGVRGEDGRVRDLLEGEGFAVFHLEDASASGNDRTVLSKKSAVSDVIVQRVRKALAGRYIVAEEDFLESGSPYDIVLSVGK